MGFLVFSGVVVILIILITVNYLNKGSFKEDDDAFEQAGVKVKYTEGTFLFKGKKFPVSKIRALRTTTGGGKYGNQSSVWIDIDDMKTPTHRIDFIRSDDASKFALRFSQAILKAGGPALT